MKQYWSSFSHSSIITGLLTVIIKSVSEGKILPLSYRFDVDALDSSRDPVEYSLKNRLKERLISGITPVKKTASLNM